MKKFLTLIALTLTTLVGYSQTDFNTLMDFTIWGNEVTFNLPENDENYTVLNTDVGLPGSTTGYNSRITQVKLISTQGFATLDCGECVFNTTSELEERTITVSGNNGTFNIQVQLSGYIPSLGATFPGQFINNTLTPYTFTTYGLNITTSIDDLNSLVFEVGQNFPNPFSNTTSVEFTSPENSTVDFSVFDMSGKLVENRKVNVERGVNTIEYGDRLSSGVYFYSITHNNTVYTKRMVKN